MRDTVMAIAVAVATFGVVSGGIVSVGLATAEPVAPVHFATAAPAAVPAVALAGPSRSAFHRAAVAALLTSHDAS